MKRCGECGSTDIIIKSAKGKHFPYKEYRQIPLVFDYDVRTCRNCDNIILSNKNIWELNELLEKSVQALVEGAISDIVTINGVRQIDVASMIGQTPQYVSHLKAGSKTPSFATLSLLRIYAKHPSIMEEFTGYKAHSFLVPALVIESFSLDQNESLSWGSGQVKPAYGIIEQSCTERRNFQYDTKIDPINSVPVDLLTYSKMSGRLGARD